MANLQRRDLVDIVGPLDLMNNIFNSTHLLHSYCKSCFHFDPTLSNQLWFVPGVVTLDLFWALIRKFGSIFRDFLPLSNHRPAPMVAPSPTATQDTPMPASAALESFFCESAALAGPDEDVWLELKAELLGLDCGTGSIPSLLKIPVQVSSDAGALMAAEILFSLWPIVTTCGGRRLGPGACAMKDVSESQFWPIKAPCTNDRPR